MKRLLLTFGLLVGFCLPALAQPSSFNGGCAAASGINSVPRNGVSCPSDSIAPTYGAISIGLVPAASATDIACIGGSSTAGNVVRLQGIRVSGSAGTLVSLPVVILRRATADSGGTPATGTALPAAAKYDTQNPTSGVTLVAYTANPTINDSSPLYLDAGVVTLNVTTAAGGAPLLFSWNTRAYNEAPVLRGAAQQICVNLNAVSVSSGVLAITFFWTEQAQ